MNQSMSGQSFLSTSSSINNQNEMVQSIMFENSAQVYICILIKKIFLSNVLMYFI